MGELGKQKSAMSVFMFVFGFPTTLSQQKEVQNTPQVEVDSESTMTHLDLLSINLLWSAFLLSTTHSFHYCSFYNSFHSLQKCDGSILFVENISLVVNCFILFYPNPELILRALSVPPCPDVCSK